MAIAYKLNRSGHLDDCFKIIILGKVQKENENAYSDLRILQLQFFRRLRFKSLEL